MFFFAGAFLAHFLAQAIAFLLRFRVHGIVHWPVLKLKHYLD